MTWRFSVRRAERFARAVEEASPDRAAAASDESLAPLVAVVDRLRTADLDGAPTPEFTARLRAQLVAAAARQAEGTRSERLRRQAARPTRTGWLRTALARFAPRRGFDPRPRSRPGLAAAAGALSVLVVLGGVAVVASSRALPGDTLYSLKRTTEGVELALAHGDAAKARRHLDFADARARELRALVGRDGQAPGHGGGSTRLSAGQLALVRSTLHDMDRETRTGARMLSGLAVTTMANGPLTELSRWADGQRHTLDPIARALPTGPASAASDAVALLDRISSRVAALRSELTCSCIDRANGDDLGPLPCWPCASTTPPPPDPALGGGPHRTGVPPPPTSGGTVASSTSPTGTAPSGAPGGSGGPPTSSPSGTSQPLPLPLPTGTGSLPGLPEGPGPTQPTAPNSGGLLPTLLPSGLLPPLLPGLPNLLPGLGG